MACGGAWSCRSPSKILTEMELNEREIELISQFLVEHSDAER